MIEESDEEQVEAPKLIPVSQTQTQKEVSFVLPESETPVQSGYDSY